MTGATLQETVASVLDVMLGKPDGPQGQLTAAVREQIMPQVEAKIKPMYDDIEMMRESLAKGPPISELKSSYPAAPWSTGAEALGIPDPNWYNPEADGAKLDGKFDGFGDFVTSVIRRDIRRMDDDRLLDISTSGGMKSQLTGEEINLGGALVPEEFRPILLSGTLGTNSIRNMAMTLPMGSNTLSVPSIRDADHSSGTVFGGIKFQWLEVNTEIPETEPDFKLTTLTARSLAARTVLPNTLLDDSIVTVPALIMRLYQEGIPWVEEGVFLRGDGAGKPLGVLNSPARVDVPRKTAAMFGVEDLYDMEAHLPPGSSSRAVWVMHPQVLPQLGNLNRGLQIWHPQLSATMPQTLNGRPIMYSEHASGLGARGDVMLVDWMYYLIGDRQALSMAASPHEKFSAVQTVLRGVERIDGTPWIDTAVIPAQRTGDNYRMSPFVVLADAA